MPGIHPTSRRQVRYAFAAEARGELPRGTARRWAHRWKCWTNPSASLTKECREAMHIIAGLSRERSVLPIGLAVKRHKKKRRAA